MPWLFFVGLLAYATVRGEQRSSRIGAFIALLATLVLSWLFVALAFAMNDDPSSLPLVLAGAFCVSLLPLGFFAFQRKAK